MTILIAFFVFSLVVLLMSLGVIFSGRRIQGSCGGLGSIPGIESDCGGLCQAKGGKSREKACNRRSRDSAEGARAGPDSTRRGIGGGNSP